jgi:hypothetical protein
MKHYLLEPTYKKSLVEFTLFKRKDEEGKDIFLRKELGWRWGSFMISVPDTEEEAMEYLASEGYEGEDAFLNWAMDFGFTIADAATDEIEVPEEPMLELIERQLLPEETDDFVDISEDYHHAEFVDSWDGCWEFWSVDSYHKEIPEEEQEAIIEEVDEVYEEMHEEGVEELGWEFVDTYFELHCSPKITPCDENGKVSEDADT